MIPVTDEEHARAIEIDNANRGGTGCLEIAERSFCDDGHRRAVRRHVAVVDRDASPSAPRWRGRCAAVAQEATPIARITGAR
jgi:hypothetical protein